MIDTPGADITPGGVGGIVVVVVVVVVVAVVVVVVVTTGAIVVVVVVVPVDVTAAGVVPAWGALQSEQAEAALQART